jgi:hypothetical protein
MCWFPLSFIEAFLLLSAQDWTKCISTFEMLDKSLVWTNHSFLFQLPISGCWLVAVGQKSRH